MCYQIQNELQIEVVDSSKDCMLGGGFKHDAYTIKILPNNIVLYLTVGDFGVSLNLLDFWDENYSTYFENNEGALFTYELLDSELPDGLSGSLERFINKCRSEYAERHGIDFNIGQNNDPPSFDCCPYCGSKDGYYTKYTETSVTQFRYTYDGALITEPNEADIEVVESVPGQKAYCIKCNKALFNVHYETRSDKT